MRNLLSPFIVYWLIRKWDHDCDIGWVKRLWHSEGIDMFISFRWKVWLVRWITFSVTSWFLLMLPLTSWIWFRSLQRIMHRCGPWAQRALVFNTSSLYIWESNRCTEGWLHLAELVRKVEKVWHELENSMADEIAAVSKMISENWSSCGAFEIVFKHEHLSLSNNACKKLFLLKLGSDHHGKIITN